MASTTWVSELPSSAAARCAEARSVWSILIVRCGRRPVALATRRCGNGGGGSQGTTCSRSSAGARRRTRACTACRLMPSASASGRSGQPASFSAASVADSISLRPEERSSRRRAAIRSGSTSRGGTGGREAPATGGPGGWVSPKGDPGGWVSPTGGPGGWVPPGGEGERRTAGCSGRSSRRANTACTYWCRPCVTTSDIVRPSRARRALSRCLRSWSSRKVSSRLAPCVFISPRRGPGQPPGRDRWRSPPARPRPGPGTGAPRRRAAAGSSRAAGP